MFYSPFINSFPSRSLNIIYFFFLLPFDKYSKILFSDYRRVYTKMIKYKNSKIIRHMCKILQWLLSEGIELPDGNQCCSRRHACQGRRAGRNSVARWVNRCRYDRASMGCELGERRTGRYTIDAREERIRGYNSIATASTACCSGDRSPAHWNVNVDI